MSKGHMTLLNVVFRYGVLPDETGLRALDRVRQVYGVRNIRFEEKAPNISIEYDASRLTEQDLGALLRSAGIDIQPWIGAAA
jgi:hypothetical protein